MVDTVLVVCPCEQDHRISFDAVRRCGIIDRIDHFHAGTVLVARQENRASTHLSGLKFFETRLCNH